MSKTQNAQSLSLALADHNIGFHLAAEDQIYGHLTLKRGAVIRGLVDGNIECAAGSVIVTSTGTVIGSITAERVYIEGQVKTPQGSANQRVVATELIAVSSTAMVEADLISKAFAIHSSSIRGALHTLEGGV